MTQGRWTTLAVLLLAALWLAGCGGGGDDGVKQDLEGQLEALMAERDVAKAAQADRRSCPCGSRGSPRNGGRCPQGG